MWPLRTADVPEVRIRGQSETWGKVGEYRGCDFVGFSQPREMKRVFGCCRQYRPLKEIYLDNHDGTGLHPQLLRRLRWGKSQVQVSSGIQSEFKANLGNLLSLCLKMKNKKGWGYKSVCPACMRLLIPSATQIQNKKQNCAPPPQKLVAKKHITSVSVVRSLSSAWWSVWFPGFHEIVITRPAWILKALP